MSAAPVEWEILLACGRQAVHDRAPEELSLHGVEWARLLELADLHGLIPHLHRLLADMAVPAEIHTQLAAQARQIARQNLYMAGELHRLLDEFRAIGIDPICFKGPALATLLYGGVGLRQFSDLDALVPEAQARPAIDLLHALGYRDTEPDHGPQASSLHEVRLLHDARRVAFEIHWGLAAPVTGISPDLNGCRERAHTLLIAGKPALVLASEDRVIFLAAHGAAHGWNRLGWLCDLARLIRTDTAIDWGVVAGRARDLHCERVLGLALALCETMLEVAIPDAVRAASRRDRMVPALAGYLAARCKGHPGRPPRRLLALAMRERPRDQLRLIALNLFRPGPWDHDFFGLPPWAWPVAGLLRPIRLFVRHGIEPLRKRGSGNR